MEILPLVQVAIQLLPTLEEGVQETVEWISKIRQTAQQKGEWTDAMEDAYQQSLLASAKDPAYQPDPPPAPGA